MSHSRAAQTQNSSRIIVLFFTSNLRHTDAAFDNKCAMLHAANGNSKTSEISDIKCAPKLKARLLLVECGFALDQDFN
ncbi:hypothetical protein F2P81_005591 [Scophthalmus maximus]|uniref:Uncharacterized protein n=1 Tax=Scophthalmus maximus TaxID=52904 RepID=A0A6A4TAZ0_SCOMX|nr:hypothetical protein F2P81_005591 [Scophthalmus maximus]